MSFKMKVSEPEKYVWWPIDELKAEVPFTYEGKNYVAKVDMICRYLKCRDYYNYNSMVFDELETKVKVYDDNGNKVKEFLLDIRYCFDVNPDDDFIEFDEEKFAKEVRSRFESVNIWG